MNEAVDRIDELELEINRLEQSMAGAATMTSTFRTELSAMQDNMLYSNREVQNMSRSIGGGLRRAFDGVVFDGMRLSDALRNVATSMVDAAYNTAVRPVQNALGGFIANGVNSLLGGIAPFEQGGAFSGGRVTPFARGGIVSSPTTFPMRGGMGLMGEAGPEAIMPLVRGADGKLGVASQDGGGGRPVHVTMNINTPDAASFQRSRSQIAAHMSRAMARGQRNR